MTADAAFPHAFTGLFEDLLHFDVLEELEIALFMSLFDGADGAELGGEFREAFFFSFLGELDVHVGPFVVFAFSGGLEVGGRGLDAAESGLEVLFGLGAGERLGAGGGGLFFNLFKDFGALAAERVDVVGRGSSSPS